MIVSLNPQPSMSDFVSLMSRTDLFLNEDGKKRPHYYMQRNGRPLEEDVKAALDICAQGTPFEGTLKKISGQKFPDIVAANLYGVEVKSTKEDHWTSTGSSILESSRIPGVERIYMTFGKLGGNPVEFLSRPYEECLSGIAVTHMPRYLIDMRLQKGETIFDKMGIPYDTLRLMDDPIAPVSQYYRNHLRPGQRLWWTGDNVEQAVSPTIRLWSNLSPKERKNYIAYACVNFPEIFGGNYDNYALWLTSQGVVDPHLRDQFSAGGQESLYLSDGSTYRFPGIYRRVKDNLFLILAFLGQADSSYFEEKEDIRPTPLVSPHKLEHWIGQISQFSKVDTVLSSDALYTLFSEWL